jgi:hypothetical protein
LSCLTSILIDVVDSLFSFILTESISLEQSSDDDENINLLDITYVFSGNIERFNSLYNTSSSTSAIPAENISKGT